MSGFRKVFFLGVVLSTLFLFGCINPDSDYQEGGRPGFREGRGNFGNLTENQRQAFFAEQLKLAARACEAKALNESCFFQSPRGNRTVSGFCQTLNGTLSCGLPFEDRAFRDSRGPPPT